MRYSPAIACLWALSGAGTVVVTWHDAISSGIQLIYLALTAIGGGCILLYQKKLAADRENSDNLRAAGLAFDLAAKAKADEIATIATRTALQEVHQRLDAVIVQRDHLAQRNDQLLDQMAHLVDRIEKTRCVFPLADGVARCFGQEKPPCTV
jgi:hypothetical protein